MSSDTSEPEPTNAQGPISWIPKALVVGSVLVAVLIFVAGLKSCQHDQSQQPAQAQQQAGVPPVGATASATTTSTVAAVTTPCADASETVENYCAGNSTGSPMFGSTTAGDYLCTNVIVGDSQPSSLEGWTDGRWQTMPVVSADTVQAADQSATSFSNYRFVGHLGDQMINTGYWLTKPGHPCVAPSPAAA